MLFIVPEVFVDDVKYEFSLEVKRHSNVFIYPKLVLVTEKEVNKEGELPVRKVFMLALCASLTGVCPE